MQIIPVMQNQTFRKFACHIIFQKSFQYADLLLKY